MLDEATTSNFAGEPETVKLADLSDFITKGSTPTTYGFEWQSSGIPFLRSECVGEEGFTKSGLAFIGQDAHDAMLRSQLTSGDLLITITGNVGRVAKLPAEYKLANMNQHIARVRIVDKKRADAEFVQHLLSSPDYRRYFQSIITGLAYPQLSLKQIRETEVQLPPLAEQQRIAEILTSMDDTIRATEAVIAQTERVKLGVMEDLLTGGLRSEAIANGEVPDGWEVSELKISGVEIIDGDRGKSYPKAADFASEGHCLFLSAKNVTKSGFQFETKQFLTEEKHNQLRKGHLHRNDIVLTTRGTLGNIAFYDADAPFSVVRINSGMVLLRNNGAELETEFLYQLMRSPVLQSQIAAASFGSAQPQLTVKIINALKLPIPPKSEQSRILAAISSVNDNISANKALLSQTKRLKQGLMSDLLTGKKRVV